MRFVCREWYEIIQEPIFVNEHLLQSNYGILYKRFNNGQSRLGNIAKFVEIGKSGFMSASYLKLQFDSKILATCNGLLLYSKNRCLFAGNPSTSQELGLPLLSSFARVDNTSMAYAASSRVLKVVHGYYGRYYDRYCSSFSCSIITVGVDKAWRQVETKHLCPLAWQLLHSGHPYSTGRFVHWTSQQMSSVLTLDVDCEVIQLHPLPESSDKRGKWFLVMGNSFSFMTCENLVWEVWILTGKGVAAGWTKLANIDLQYWTNLTEGSVRSAGCYPVGWLKNGELLMFCFCRINRQRGSFPLPGITYDMKSWKLKPFYELSLLFLNEGYHSHLNTLVSPKGF